MSLHRPTHVADLITGLRAIWPWRCFDRQRVTCRLLIQRLKMERDG